MGDPFDAATQAVNAQRRKVLADMALEGEEARKRHAAVQQAQQAQRMQSLGAMIGESNVRRAPEALQQELSGKMLSQGARYDAAVGDLGAQHQRSLDRQASAHSAYMSEVDAAIPLARMWAEQARAEKLAEQQSPDRIIGRLGGKELAGDLLSRATDSQMADFSERRGANGPGSAPRPREVVADELAQQRLGLPAGYGPVLLPRLSTEKAARPTQVLADAKAQEELDARNARLALLDTAKRAASPGTFDELGKAIDVGESANDIQAAFDYVESLDSEYLKRHAISKPALIDWIRRYGSI